METATIEMFSDAENLSENAQARLSEYLEGFHKPAFRENTDGETATITCPKCKGHIMSGGLMDAIFSNFQWGLAHGEGFCSECKWPIRMYHFIQLDGDDEQRIVFPLAHRCYTDKTKETEVDPSSDGDKQ